MDLQTIDWTKGRTFTLLMENCVTDRTGSPRQCWWPPGTCDWWHRGLQLPNVRVIHECECRHQLSQRKQSRPQRCRNN